jgi:hypothetical protein
MSEFKDLIVRVGRAVLNEIEAASKEPLPTSTAKSDAEKAPGKTTCCGKVELGNFCSSCGASLEI